MYIHTAIVLCRGRVLYGAVSILPPLFIIFKKVVILENP